MNNKGLINSLHGLCAIGEVLTLVGLCLVTVAILFSGAMIDSQSGSLGVYVDNGSLDWSFNVRIPHSEDGNFSVARRGLPPPKLEYGNVSFGSFRLRPDPSALQLNSRNARAGAVQIDNIEGTVTIKRPEKASEVLASVRWPFLACMLCTGGAGLAVLDLLRRMFRSAGRGEVFTNTNIRYVRSIGWLLIASSFLKLLSAMWLVAQMASYVTGHTAGNVGLENSFDGDLHMLGAGFVILALAEVFRQGLALKEESSLTI